MSGCLPSIVTTMLQCLCRHRAETMSRIGRSAIPPSTLGLRMQGLPTFYCSNPRPATRGASASKLLPTAAVRVQVQPFSSTSKSRRPPPPTQMVQRPYYPTKSSIYPTITECKFLQDTRSFTSFATNGAIFEASKESKKPAPMAKVKEYALLCLENPLLDIQAFGDDDLLKKYNLKPNDAILAEESQMGLYEDLLTNYDAKLLAGGAAQNTARGAQYILPPNSVVYLGGVGDDKYAAILHDAVGAAGLRVEYRVDPKEPTGRCGVVITGHNRSLCTALGAANHYDLDHLKKAEIWTLAENAEVFYIGGYHFTVCPDAIMELGKLAAEKNKIFALNLSAPFIAQFFKDAIDAASPYCDYIICNETEAGAYAESHGIASRDPRELAKHLANLPKENKQRKRVAIITQGTDPTLIAVQDEDEVRDVPVHSIDASQINDTNGAGDAFAGGFLAGLVVGKPLETCVDMGQWLARLSIQELGPSYPMPPQAYPGL